MPDNAVATGIAKQSGPTAPKATRRPLESMSSIEAQVLLDHLQDRNEFLETECELNRMQNARIQREASASTDHLNERIATLQRQKAQQVEKRMVRIRELAAEKEDLTAECEDARQLLTGLKARLERDASKHETEIISIKLEANERINKCIDKVNAVVAERDSGLSESNSGGTL